MLTLRPVGLQEIEVLKELSIKTFTNAFARFNTAGNMQQYIDNNLSTARLLKEMNTAGSAFYFAEKNGQICGYLKLNTGEAQTDLKTHNNTLEIERIYILHEFQNQKIGQFLFDQSLEIAKKSGKKTLWLAVWEHNPGAIAFYKRNSLTEFGSHQFKLGDDLQTDILMKREV